MGHTTLQFLMRNGRKSAKSFDSEIAAITYAASVDWADIDAIFAHAGNISDPFLWLWESPDDSRDIATSRDSALEFAALMALGLDADQAESESLVTFWTDWGDWENPESAAMVKAILALRPDHLGEFNPEFDSGMYQLARVFIAELKADLVEIHGQKSLPDILARINSRNANPVSPGACATHDFCEANTPMARAFLRVTGRAADPASESDARAINRAWDHAKRVGFGENGGKLTPYGEIVQGGIWTDFHRIKPGETFAAFGGVWTKLDESSATGIWPACLPEKHKFSLAAMVAQNKES